MPFPKDPNAPPTRSTGPTHPSSYSPPADPLGDEIEEQERRDRDYEKADPGPFPGARRDYETTDLEGAARFERDQQAP